MNATRSVGVRFVEVADLPGRLTEAFETPSFVVPGRAPILGASRMTLPPDSASQDRALGGRCALGGIGREDVPKSNRQSETLTTRRSGTLRLTPLSGAGPADRGPVQMRFCVVFPRWAAS